MRLKAFGDGILAINGDFNDVVTEAGLLVKTTIGKAEGITPRWFEVLEVGPDIKHVKPGDWVLVAYGRWTEHFKFTDDRIGKEVKVWKIEAESCLATSDINPMTNKVYYNTEVVTAPKKDR